MSVDLFLIFLGAFLISGPTKGSHHSLQAGKKQQRR